jgi:hypothetical protein
MIPVDLMVPVTAARIPAGDGCAHEPNGTATGQPSSSGTFSQRSDRTRARRSAARQRRRASPTGRSPAALDDALVRRPHTTIMVEPAAVEISCPRPCPAPARPRRSRRCSAPRLRPGGPGGRRNRGGAAVHPPDPQGAGDALIRRSANVAGSWTEAERSFLEREPELLKQVAETTC